MGGSGNVVSRSGGPRLERRNKDDHVKDCLLLIALGQKGQNIFEGFGVDIAAVLECSFDGYFEQKLNEIMSHFKCWSLIQGTCHLSVHLGDEIAG